MIPNNESNCKLEILIKQNEILFEQNKQLILLVSTFMTDYSDKLIQQSNDFKIPTIEKASVILECSVPTLRNAIADNKLIENIDYKFNGGRKYSFSLSSLDKYKGKL